MISAEESDEIRLLRAEYFAASKRAAEAIQTGDHPLDGTELNVVIEEHERAVAAMQRIKEIYSSALGSLTAPIKLPNSGERAQPEIPKVGSRDALGG
jgi:hypothetical protein